MNELSPLCSSGCPHYPKGRLSLAAPLERRSRRDVRPQLLTTANPAVIVRWAPDGDLETTGETSETGGAVEIRSQASLTEHEREARPSRSSTSASASASASAIDVSPRSRPARISSRPVNECRAGEGNCLGGRAPTTLARAPKGPREEGSNSVAILRLRLCGYRRRNLGSIVGGNVYHWGPPRSSTIEQTGPRVFAVFRSVNMLVDSSERMPPDSLRPFPTHRPFATHPPTHPPAGPSPTGSTARSLGRAPQPAPLG